MCESLIVCLLRDNTTTIHDGDELISESGHGGDNGDDDGDNDDADDDDDDDDDDLVTGRS